MNSREVIEATKEESSPPDRSTPNGTSAMSRFLTCIVVVVVAMVVVVTVGVVVVVVGHSMLLHIL